MAAPNQNAFHDWYQNLGISWLVQGPNGQAEANAWPALMDSLVSQLYYSRYQSYPDKCAPDSLPHLGSDRKLIQGPNESNASFIARLKDAWGQWSRAGTACGVLEQLAYFTQSVGGVFVQQNGNSYTLSSMPTPGQDPTSLVTPSNLPTLTAPLTSAIAPPTTSSAGRSIPAGNPWISFDLNTDLTNRFAIIYPLNAWPFAALTTAYFNAADNAAVTWPFTFASSTYSINIGTPVVTDGSGPVVLHADGATQTTTGVTIRASAPFTGYASVTAYAAGVNPLNTFTTATAGQLKSIISAFRSNSLCMGVFAIQAGRMWDWPANSTWDGYGGNWDTGPSTISQIIGAF